MSTDGNLDALAKYEDKVAKDELAMEHMKEEINDLCEEPLADLKRMFDHVVESYGFEYSFEEYVKEVE